MLLRRHSLQLLFVLTALPLARCLWRALEAPPLPQRRPGDWIHEAFRSLLAGSVAVLGLYGAVSLGGRAWSWHLLLAAVAFLQPLQRLVRDLAASEVSREGPLGTGLHRDPPPEDATEAAEACRDLGDAVNTRP